MFSMRLCVHFTMKQHNVTPISAIFLSLSQSVCCQEWRLPDFGHIVPYILRYLKHSDSEMGKQGKMLELWTIKKNIKWKKNETIKSSTIMVGHLLNQLWHGAYAFFLLLTI